MGGWVGGWVGEYEPMKTSLSLLFMYTWISPTPPPPHLPHPPGRVQQLPSPQSCGLSLHRQCRNRRPPSIHPPRPHPLNHPPPPPPRCQVRPPPTHPTHPPNPPIQLNPTQPHSLTHPPTHPPTDSPHALRSSDSLSPLQLACGGGWVDGLIHPAQKEVILALLQAGAAPNAAVKGQKPLVSSLLLPPTHPPTYPI